jgi:histidyl-tRNA synthetase
MYAANANSLPKPVKWFCMPSFFRAERPQRGRLREFFQWNADIIGDNSPRADAEIIALTIGILERMGLTAEDVVVKVSDRNLVADILGVFDIHDPTHQEAVIQLIDAIPKRSSAEQIEAADRVGISADTWSHLVEAMTQPFDLSDLAKDDFTFRIEATDSTDISKWSWKNAAKDLLGVFEWIDSFGLSDWCTLDQSIVRGLAYYTGTVFEVHAKTGTERALAGGGRYDKLVELFGGPSTPAVGIAMGDVVIRLMLEDRGLLEEAEAYLPRPDVFVISALDDGGKAMGGLIAELRRAGLHARHSYKATKNVGKLLGEAGKARARCAVIIGAEWEEGTVAVKDLETKDQVEVPAAELVDRMRALARAQSGKE